MDVHKQAVLASLEPLVATLTQQHEQRALWMPDELLFPQGVDRSQREQELRDAATKVPLQLRAVFALNLITEKGLPYFTQLLGEYIGIDGPFAHWIGRWTAEEDRHGQLLGMLARLSRLLPNVDGFERLQFTYLCSGFRPKWGKDPYQLLAYTSVQEKATQISHGNLAARLKQAGADAFVQPLGRIAAEEGYHFRFYTSVVAGVFERDPDNMLISLWKMVKTFSMPGASMPYFSEMAQLASRLGIFGAGQLRQILLQLVRDWGVENIAPQSNEAGEAKARLFKHLDLLSAVQQRADTQARTECGFLLPFISSVPITA